MLIDYADKHDARELEMYSGVSLGKYISTMQESYEYNLSNDVLMKVLGANPSKSIILSMTKSIETQLTALNQMEGQINLFLK